MTVRPVKRALVSAYACDPARGSEPGVGWQSLLAALEVSEEVWLITRSKNVERVRSAIPHADRSRLHIHAVERGRMALRAKKRLPWGTQGYYVLWQRLVAAEAADLHAKHDFEVAHHSTFAVDWMPCGLSRVAGLRVVWGPVGGSSSTPFRLWRHLGARGIGSDVVHRIATGIGAAVFGRQAARASALMLAQNGDVARRFAKQTSARVQPNVAIDLDQSLQRPTAGDLVGAGRLLPWKGWALALRALAETSTDVRLTVYGDGPDRDRLETLARRLGVEDRVQFHRTIPRSELLERVAESVGFVSLSFQEAAGWAAAEAMTAGVPVIGLDLGGTEVLAGVAGVPVIDHKSHRLVSDVARAMDDPPASASTQAWTATAFRQNLGAALAGVSAGTTR